jgi:hypothetical protein
MGRGWHHGKRVDARMRGFTIRAGASDRKSSGFSRLPPKSRKTRVILIRHGQTEFNGIFSVTRQDPGVRDPHLTDRGRRQARAVAQVLLSFNLSPAHHESLRARTRNRRDHCRTSGPSDHGGAVDCRTLLVHLRHRCVLSRASYLLADLAFDPLQDPWSSQNGGKRGDGLGTISELPSTDRR